MVSPAAVPSAKVRFSSSMKCLRSGTASSTPSRPATESQPKICRLERCREKPSSGRALSMSIAASTTHMNPASPAAVPAVCTRLFSQRVPRTPVKRPMKASAR